MGIIKIRQYNVYSTISWWSLYSSVLWCFWDLKKDNEDSKDNNMGSRARRTTAPSTGSTNMVQEFWTTPQHLVPDKWDRKLSKFDSMWKLLIGLKKKMLQSIRSYVFMHFQYFYLLHIWIALHKHVTFSINTVQLTTLQ